MYGKFFSVIYCNLRLQTIAMHSFSEIQKHVMDKLLKNLPDSLTYHNIGHTLDVLKQAENIANEEGINGEELFLLKVSALYHDVGFLDKYIGHEERSCEIAAGELTTFGFTPEQLDKIFGMIRATKVPQQPHTRLEEIICDADLDYLGRPDFFAIAKGLYKEFIDQKIVANAREWDELQIRFLESHHYFTQTSIQRRQQLKQIHLDEVKNKVASFN